MNVEEKAFVIKVDQKRLNLPEWIRTLLENCPCAKGGVHKWILEWLVPLSLT